MHAQAEADLRKRAMRVANEAGAKFSARATLRGLVSGALGLGFTRYLAHSPEFVQVLVFAIFSLFGVAAGIFVWVGLVRNARAQLAQQSENGTRRE